MHVTRKHEVGCGVRMQPSLVGLREDAREATSAFHTHTLIGSVVELQTISSALGYN